MAKHVIKKDQADTVEVTEGNSEWLVETGVTLSGATALLNYDLDNVRFIIEGKLTSTGQGIVSIGESDMEVADDTSVVIRTGGRVLTDDIGLHIAGESASIRNRGLIQTEHSAVIVDSADMEIVNSGKVISENNAAVGILHGDNFSIRNDGLLQGAEIGSAVVVMSGYGRLVNGEEGVIDGRILVAGATGDTTIMNRGKIASGASGVTLSDGNDRLVNRGEIDGEISLGGGDDFADLRRGKLTNSVVEGGDGNDMFVVDRTDISIVELSGGGFDTIRTTVSYTLGNLDTDDIEILGAIGKWDIDLGGNDLNNILAGNVGDNAISGGDGFDLLVGAEGRDMLTGGGDGDSFSFAKKSGVDTITDFSLGEDDIQIKYIAGIDDFGDLQSRMSSADFDKDGDLDTVINLGDGDRIRLTDIAKDDLQMGDFNIFTA